MASVTLFGPDYSVYVRIARIALEEKGVSYTLTDVDFIGGQGMPADHLARHPFGKVPVLDHDGFRVFETLAICVYIDAAFDGPSLQPAEPKALARMFQIVGVMDSYLSYPLREELVSEWIFSPLLGRPVDDAVIARGLPPVTAALDVLDGFLRDKKFMAGADPSLADFHAAPMIGYLAMCAEGEALIAARPAIARWWRTMAARPSILETQPDLTRVGR